MDDESIIGLYFLRDEEAIRQTDMAYGRRLLALASRILLDPQDAEEAVNDTYLKAWESIPPQKPRFFLCLLGKNLPLPCHEQAGLENCRKAECPGGFPFR